ncbi:hypothetical protein NE645_17380, partial [Roseburia hominis]|nr:hypothetical protein [Roseburia hominis]
MKKFKFQGDYGLRFVFQETFNLFLQEFANDVLVPIPISPHTWKTRGIRQRQQCRRLIKTARFP